MGLANIEIRIEVFREQPEMLLAAYQKVQAEGKLRFRVGLDWTGSIYIHKPIQVCHAR